MDDINDKPLLMLCASCRDGLCNNCKMTLSTGRAYKTALYVNVTVRKMPDREFVRLHERIDINDVKQCDWVRRMQIWAMMNGHSVEFERTLDKRNEAT